MPPQVLTNLIPKGANVPKNWPWDSQEFYFYPQPTSLVGGLVVGGVMSGAVSITLTSAQLLALAATPIPILNAPVGPPKGFGSAMIIQPTELIGDYVFGGTAYTLGGADNKVQLEYTGQATNLIAVPANGLLTAAVNTWSSNVPVASQNLARTVSANLGLEAKLTGTTPGLTLGTGTLTLTLKFDIIILI